MKKRRSPIEIRIEILEHSMEQIKPTQLMYASNLSYNAFYGHIDELKARGYIEEIELDEDTVRKDKRTTINYCTTVNGANIIRMYSDATKSVG